MEESRAQIAKASLEKTMVDMRRSQADLAMVQDEKEILIDDIDYSQVGLPRLYVQNEINQPPKKKCGT